MPWSCGTCQADVVEDRLDCPECGATKTAWTVHGDATRMLVVPAKKRLRVLEASRPAPRSEQRDDDSDDSGDGGEERNAGEASGGGERVDAKRAPVVARARAEQLAADGARPAEHELLYARVSPPRGRPAELSLTILFAKAEPAEHPVDAPPEPDAEGEVEVPFLLVWGEGGGALPAFEGIEVVDVSEGTERGYAPQVEVESGKRSSGELPTEPVEDASVGEVRVQLVGPRLFPLPAVSAVLHGPAGPLDELTADEAGELRWPELPLGRYTLELSLTGRSTRVNAPWLRAGRPPHRLYVGRAAELLGERDDVHGLQLRLAALGYPEVGPIDGVVGPKTRGAVEEFQRDHHLAVDGIPGPHTQGVLRARYGA